MHKELACTPQAMILDGSAQSHGQKYACHSQGCSRMISQAITDHRVALQFVMANRIVLHEDGSAVAARTPGQALCTGSGSGARNG